MAEIDSKLAQVVQAIGQVSANQHEALTQVMQQMAAAVEQLSKPKEVVKDKGGRPIGIRTVDEI